jgi:hypothetical protein
MADLIEKFFEKDLAEAERQALREELLSKDGAAEKFVEKAEASYKEFGLPEPRWTGPDVFRQSAEPGLTQWLWLFVLLAGAIGVSMWWYFAKGNPTNENSLSSFGSEQAAPIVSLSPKPVKKKHVPVASQPITVAQMLPVTKLKANVEAPLTIQPSLPVQVQTTSTLPLLVSPKFTPVNVDQNPNKPFSSLSVVLHRSTPGFLNVRLLDSAGRELVPLYRGNLPPGTWAFEWNGLLKDGRLAPPGKYGIEVRAGSWAQVKEVLIPK